MPADFLAINVGNTRTQVGTFVAGKLGPTELVDNAQVEHADFVDMLRTAIAPLTGDDAQQSPIVLIASVNSPVSSRIAEIVKSELRVQPAFVERDITVPIGRQLDPETMVGDDRLLNAAAAYDTVKQACIVVDAGTAVTVDFVDGAGTFHGGAIAPGAKMMLSALQAKTEQLPEVAMQPPVEPVGHNTAEAMRSGAFHGIRGMVRELTERYAEAAGMYPLIIATGGDAKMLFEGYELVERIVPELTLTGMAVTLEAHRAKRDD